MRESSRKLAAADGTQLNVTIYEAEADKISPDAPHRSLLLLHGWPNAGRVWRSFAEAMLLADPHWHLVAPDLRGFGDSDKPESCYDCATFAADAEAVAREFFASEADGWSLVGHSMTGKIAQIVASHHPAGLQKLILLTPTPLVTAPLSDEAKTKLAAARETADGVREFVTGLPGHPLPDGVVDQLVDDGLRAAPNAWNGWIYMMRDEDRSAAAASITIPTLIIAGSKDARIPPTMAQTVAETIAGARFEMLPSSGHLPHLEEPDALAALVVNFLDGSLPPKVAV